MAKRTLQKPPDPLGLVTGLPYHSGWENFDRKREKLYLHGVDRDVVDRYFAHAQNAGAQHLIVNKDEIARILLPLDLSAAAAEDLSDKLYYLAGHYLIPPIQAHFGESPAQVRKNMRRLGRAAAEAAKLMAALGPTESRYLRGAKWALLAGLKGDPKFPLTDLQQQLMDLTMAANTVAGEMPQMGRGTTVQALLGDWLRESAEVFEAATGKDISTRTSDSAGINFRVIGVDGQVFETYCRRVAHGKAPAKTIVRAIRELHKVRAAPLS